jgi:hypothetical protein
MVYQLSMRTFWLSLVVAASATSCAVSYKMTVTSATPGPAKAPTCDFQVLNLVPSGEAYEEIATLTPTDARAATPERFKQAVREDVCRVGGDVVITQINGDGWYVRGTVLRKRAPDASVPAAAP